MTDKELMYKIGELFGEYVWNCKATNSTLGNRLDISNLLMDSKINVHITEFTNGYCDYMDANVKEGE